MDGHGRSLTRGGPCSPEIQEAAGSPCRAGLFVPAERTLSSPSRPFRPGAVPRNLTDSPREAGGNAPMLVGNPPPDRKGIRRAPTEVDHRPCPSSPSCWTAGTWTYIHVLSSDAPARSPRRRVADTGPPPPPPPPPARPAPSPPPRQLRRTGWPPAAARPLPGEGTPLRAEHRGGRRRAAVDGRLTLSGARWRRPTSPSTSPR